MTPHLPLAVRTLVKSPAFSLTAVAALAVGIGANTAIFSLVNQLLLNPPGISDPSRVITQQTKYDKLNLRNIGVSVPDFADVRKSTGIFEHAALIQQGDFNYSGGDVPQRLQGANVSVEWFDVFGAKPRLGRVFHPEEDRPGGNSVVVLSWAAWTRLFGRDAGVLGRVMQLNGKPYRVIGVMGPDFRWPREVELWAPLGLPPDAYSASNRFNESYGASARIRPGISFAQANAFIQVLSSRVTNASRYARDSQWGMYAVPVTDFIAGDTKQPMLVLLGAVAFVLLIACSNIAGLMIARTSGRGREIAVRAALGANRWQLMRQTIQESLLLAGMGALLGLGLAWAAMRMLLLIAPESAAAGLDAQLDGHVLLFTAIVAIASGMLFGLAPAWQIARTSPQEQLRGGGRGTTGGPGRQKLRSLLVISETALALVLLAGAGLFVRSLLRLEDVNPGFDPQGVMTASLTLPETQYKTAQQQIAFFRAVIDRLAALPGVSAAGIGIPLPFSGADASASFSIEGRVSGPGDPGPHGDQRYVTPGYFAALRIPVRSGRVFTDQDRMDTPRVAVIDENLARQYWPSENPIGRRLRNGKEWATIVGVVGHVKHSDLAVDRGKGVYYYSMLQDTPVPFASLTVRTSGDPVALGSAIRQAVQAIDPKQPVYDVRTFDAMVQGSLAARRFVIRVMEFFAVTALFLCALGLYGVIAYSVSQRTQELGLRMALGAQRSDVLGLVVGQGLRLAGSGAGIGLLAAFGLARLIRNQLYGISAFDALTMIVTPLVLMGAALLASWIPARRATKVDPLNALRYE